MTDARLRNTALLVAGCFFMENLDGTIVITAAPRIGRALDVPSTSVGLVIAAYMVTLAVLIPLSGWLAARWGARRVFLSAIAIFTLSSLACAPAPAFAELVGFRVLQGVGGAMMVPVGRLVVLSRTEKSQMLRTVGLLVWPALVAPVIAPLAGGLITTYASWRWLFLVNVPLGVLALAVAWRLIDSPRTDDAPPLDPAGVVLTCGGLAAATYMAYLLSQSQVSWPAVIGCGVVAVGALSRRDVATCCAPPHPLVNLRTLRVPTFRAALGSGSLFWTAITAVPFLLTLLFQNVFGWSPVKSGAVVLFVFVGNIGIKPATTPMLRRFGFRPGAGGRHRGCRGHDGRGRPCSTPQRRSSSSRSWRCSTASAARSASRATRRSPSATPRPSRSVTPTRFRPPRSSLRSGSACRWARWRSAPGGALSGALPGAPTATSPYTIAFLLLAVVALGGTVGALRLHPDAGAAVTRRPGREPAAATAAGDP